MILKNILHKSTYFLGALCFFSCANSDKLPAVLPNIITEQTLNDTFSSGLFVAMNDNKNFYYYDLAKIISE